MPKEDNFFQRVYQIVRLIPVGRVTSYGAIAKAIGAPQSARMVGYAMNSAVNMEDVPAHRVVNRNGLLTGKHHFKGSNIMKEMLEAEGVRVKNDKIEDFKKVFWQPSEVIKYDQNHRNF